jgi:hypothetical protein
MNLMSDMLTYAHAQDEHEWEEGHGVHYCLLLVVSFILCMLISKLDRSNNELHGKLESILFRSLEALLLLDATKWVFAWGSG